MALPSLSLSLQFGRFDTLAAHRTALPRHKVARWIRHALQADGEITVRIVDAEEGQALNRDYRHKDYATNVLTFDYDAQALEGEAGLAGPVVVGDLVLCVPVLVREAEEQGKAIDAHFAHLVVHGMLHLQGFDHEDDAEAEEMEAREREILAALGYPDPYAGER